MQKDFDLLEPKDKLQFLAKILDYVIPKMKNIEVETTLSIEAQKKSIEDLFPTVKECEM